MEENSRDMLVFGWFMGCKGQKKKSEGTKIKSRFFFYVSESSPILSICLCCTSLNK